MPSLGAAGCLTAGRARNALADLNLPQRLRQLGDVGGEAPRLVALKITGTPSAGIGFARLGPKTGVRYATKTRRLV